MSSERPRSAFTFTLSPGSSEVFGPRLGQVTLQRPDSSAPLEVATPGIMASTSCGVVPHLSRDSVLKTPAVRWVHVPFESFLERKPPIPTLYPGTYPLHQFLGFKMDRHVLTMTLRDPFDGRKVPTNGHDFVSAYCLRGVRKVTPTDWRKSVLACNPDIVMALTDIPFTAGPISQKRTEKSIERSARWLATLLQPLPPASDAEIQSAHLNVLVHMVGGTNTAARQAFSHTLLEPLYNKEAEAIKPFKTLDEGVAGYTFDLIPLHKALSIASAPAPPSPAPNDLKTTMSELDPTPNVPSLDALAQLPPLLRASLAQLPHTKPRFAHSAGSAHEMLILIRDVGIDVFDAHWAQRAADIGIALDFVFPAPALDSARDLGHNLYDARYAHDFSPFADAFAAHCPCMACTPLQPPTSAVIHHGALDGALPPRPSTPFTRAYAHHLLHTHEMSAHALLAAHNLCVLDAFLAGVRRVLVARPEAFAPEVARFDQAYDGRMRVFGEARAAWAQVEMARGKGRLLREKEKQDGDALGTAVEL